MDKKFKFIDLNSTIEEFHESVVKAQDEMAEKIRLSREEVKASEEDITEILTTGYLPRLKPEDYADVHRYRERNRRLETERRDQRKEYIKSHPPTILAMKQAKEKKECH